MAEGLGPTSIRYERHVLTQLRPGRLRRVGLIHSPPNAVEPYPGVAFSFWAALAGLSALGIRYPLAMLPLILMQLFYKVFWLLAVYVSLRAASRSSDLTQGMLIGIALDIIVIPWTYVFAHYIKKPGDRWRKSR